MMPRFNLLGLLTVGLLSALTTYVVAQTWHSGPAAESEPDDVRRARAVATWLELDKQQAGELASHDPSFFSESIALEAALAREREQLARLLENPDSPDEAIRRQVEAVIHAHDSLERRVADFVLAVRAHLTPEQQRRLLEPFATAVRESGGWRWRHGRANDTDPPGPGPRGGRGRGPGRGWGPPDRLPASQPTGDQP